MTELISIIVPIYNLGNYLPDCICSIQAQTYKDLEALLVDDGSTDDSGEIAEKAAKADSRIRVIHQKNKGLSSARNTGIGQARGEYIFFLDGDDWIEPTAISELYEAAKRHCAELVICNLTEFEEPEGSLHPHTAIREERLISGADILWESTRNTKEFLWVITCSKLYHRSIFESIRYPEGKLHEDEFVFHHIMCFCEKVVCIPAHLYIYRKREGSITRSKQGIRRLDGVEALLLRSRDFLDMPGFEEPARITFFNAIYVFEKFFRADPFRADGAFAQRIGEIQKLVNGIVPRLMPSTSRAEQIWLRIYRKNLYAGIRMKVLLSACKRKLRKLMRNVKQ